MRKFSLYVLAFGTFGLATAEFFAGTATSARLCCMKLAFPRLKCHG
ncbi:MAG: Het-C domain-containing protein [Alphaproteobacteria bacterium]|nr:Het-C domain-containing protein [Alphaproteobacteria bacterium]